MDQQKRRKREQEKQKRERLVQSKADSFPSQSHSPSLPPHFPSLKRTDGQSDELTRLTKNILGPYDACHEAIFKSVGHHQQHQLLGTFEATPSTPLHVSGNPFDKQFGRSTELFPPHPTTTAAGSLSTKSSLTSTSAAATSSSSSSLAFSLSGSSTQSRDHHNRHSVAEAPGKSDDKSGKQSRGSGAHPRSNCSSHGSKMSRQSSDSKYKKAPSKPQGEGQPSSEGAGLRPSNVLPVRKKEKSRVRPFKSGGGVSPTAGPQPGPTLSKKSGGTGSSQGAGDLFRVDPEGGGASRSATPVGAEGTPSSHPRTVTPPIPPYSSKKSAKLKKRHSHHSSLSAPTVHPAPPNQGVTTPTNDALPGNTLPSGGSSAPQTMRKSNSVQSSVSLSSFSSSSSSHHKHRKQSTSTTGTTSTVHSSSAKKHGSSSSQLSSSLSQPSLSSVKTTTSSTEATAFRTDPTSIDNPPSSLPPPSTSSSSVMATGKSDNASNVLPTLADEKQAKRKRKKRKEREKGQEAVATGSEVNRDRNPDKNLEIKSEPSDHTKTASQLIHSSDRTERQHLEQEATKSLSNLQRLAGEETRVAPKGVKLEKIGKPRPSNLTIDSYGNNTAEDSPLDIKDVQSLLKELMSNVSVPSPITPIPTPRRSKLFTFPQAPSLSGNIKLEDVTEAPPISPAHQMSESDSSDSSSSESSSESSDCDEDNEQGQEKMEGMLPEAPLPMEEVEDNTSLGWEKVLPTLCDSITPLRKTPPHLVAKTPQLSSVIPAGFHLPTISPLAPDSPAHSPPNTTKPPASSFSGFGGFILGANLLGITQTASEAENPSSSHSLDFLGSSADVRGGGVPDYSQTSGEMKTTLLEANTDSLGFSGVASSSAPVFATSLETAAVGEASGSESDGEGAGGESGSESDDESSDGEEDSDCSSSSGDEGEEKINPTSQHPLLETAAAVQKSSVGSSVSSAAFFSGDDSFSFQGGGFFNDEDFLSRLQAGAENSEMDVDDVDALSHEPSASLVSELQPGPLDVQSNTDVWMGGEKPPPEVNVPPTQQERPVNPVSSDAALTSSTSNSRTQPQAGGVSTAGTSATAMVTPSRITTQLSVDGATSQTAGKKRKLERQSSLVTASDLAPLPPPARKTPRTTAAAPRVRRHSSLSSFSVSSDSSSSSSDSSGDEDSDADEDSRLSNSVVHLSSPQPSTLSHTSSTAAPSTSGITSQNAPSLPPASVPLLANRRDSIVAPLQQGGLEAGELEEEEMEGEWTEGGKIESLLVKISLQTVDFQKEQKPKAKVGPYNVTAPSKPPRRRSTVDSSTHEDLSRLPGGHHGVDHDRAMYGRQRDRDDDHHGQYGRTDFHRDDGRRTHRGSGWDGRESWSGGRHGARPGRSHDRDTHHHRNRNWDEYGAYDDTRSRGRSHLSNRNLSAEECLREARKKKHEADRTRPPGIDKAKAYLESVAYFMRHGDAIEREAQSWDGAQTRSPFRLYMDTITLMKYCRSWASDCKQLVALCMRCVSVLYWKLFQLKQTSAANIQKDLQDFFIPTKSTQKSPYPGSLSPIPSPASVGSTTSTGSGVGGASSLSSTQDPSPSSHVTVPKQVFNKAAEHLTITGYLHQSLELWQQSNLLVEQYRDFFNTLDRRSGCRITQFSPISVVADWIETGARLIHYRS